MRRIRMHNHLVTFILLCLFVLVGTTVAQAGVTLRMAHVLKKGDTAYLASAKLAELVEKYTDGRVKINVFPSGQLGNNTKLFTQIRSGAVDITMTPFTSLCDIVPEFALMNAGYMFDNWEQVKILLDHPDFGKVWQERLLHEGGLHILSAFYYGDRCLTTSKKEIHSPEDVQGLKIRAVPNTMSLAVVTGLGGKPTPVPWTETFQALRQGIVDGQENPIPVLYAAKLYEVQKYLIKTNHQCNSLPFVIRESKWSKISPEDQKLFMQAASEAAQIASKATVAYTNSLVDKLKKEGMTIVELTDEERNAFKTGVRAAVAEKFDGKMLPAGLIQKVLDLYK